MEKLSLAKKNRTNIFRRKNQGPFGEGARLKFGWDSWGKMGKGKDGSLNDDKPKEKDIHFSYEPTALCVLIALQGKSIAIRCSVALCVPNPYRGTG